MSIKVRLASFISRLKTRQHNLKSGYVSPAVVIPVVCDQSLSKQQDLSTVDMCGLPPPPPRPPVRRVSASLISVPSLWSGLISTPISCHLTYTSANESYASWVEIVRSSFAGRKKKKNPILRIIRPSCVNFSLTQLRWHNAHRISPRKVRTGHHRRQLPSEHCLRASLLPLD